MEQKPISLAEMLDLLEKSADDRENVTIDMILNELGPRSFGPVLLLAGLFILAPLIGDIPGIPTIMGVLVLLTAGQLLLRRDHLWLPHWLLQRSVNKRRFCRGIGWLRPVARFIDRLVKPRLMSITRTTGSRIIAVFCILIAAAIPPMEFVPFSANIAGVSLTILGLALTARDGLLALLAFLLVFIGSGLAAYFITFG